MKDLKCNSTLVTSDTPTYINLQEVKFNTTVVIPVYFNELSIERVVREIKDEWKLSGRSEKELEFILVDDGSGDGSWKVLQNIQKRFPETVTAVQLVKNHGSQLAILAGLSFVRGSRIALISADGQEPSNLVARMADIYDTGERLILATRQSRKDSLSTKVSASAFYKIVRWLGLKQMPTNGFDALLMDREIARIISDMRDPNIPLTVTIAWLGYSYVEVPYKRLERQEGHSRWTISKKIKLALDAITSVSYVPIRFISLFGVVIALLGFLFAAFVIVEQVVFGFPVRGWTSLLVAILFLGGTQLISLGVIGEYLWRTLEAVRNRPLWRISEVKRLIEQRSDT